VATTIHFVALGCPKNRVDTERMMGLAGRLGLEPVADPHEADIIVVNTCGFILPAKEESIETILELAVHKTGRCCKLVVAGCLPQRYPEELAQEMPEVDHFIGTADLPRLEGILAGREVSRVSVGTPGIGSGEEVEETYERALVGHPHTAYLKIAEGCDRLCAFCIIPRIRGPGRSRTVASLCAEAEQLAVSGVRELVLVAQDTTAYGHDLSPQVDLVDLLERLDGLRGLRWIRILYSYPSAIEPRLIRAIRDVPHVVPYLDLPIQHIDDGVLRRMRRGYGGGRVRDLIAELRATVPHIFLRGTLLCGHPGETPQAHQALLDFVGQAEMDHLGVFPFSAEEGTHAATLPDQVPAEVAQDRAAEMMELQRRVSRRRLARLRGQQLDVLVDGPSEESEYLLQGRHAGQAPEVDGVVILTDCAAKPGDLITARVTDSADHDLVATPVEP
jgi:ribosomal protein S12 methylthiotransferase